MAAAAVMPRGGRMFHSKRGGIPRAPVDKDLEKSLESSPFYNKTKLMSEYKALKHELPVGVCVMPSFASMFVWDGAIILRDGFYQGAMFKFQIQIPQEYPSERPTVQFSSRVFHPQVSSSGELNLSPAEESLNDPNGYILPLLHYIQSVFFFIDTENPSNPVAAIMYSDCRREFKKEVRACVRKSLEYALDTEDRGSTFRISEFAANLDVIRQYALGRERKLCFSRRASTISNYLDPSPEFA